MRKGYPLEGGVTDPSLPGWEIFTVQFDSDSGRSWGVAISRIEPDGTKPRRNAVRVPEGILTREEAIDRALPALREWAEAA